jgi:hypothetical protein
LDKLKILQRQSPLSDVDELLSEELKEYANKAASGESLDTNSICQQIQDNFSDWWDQTGKVHWLSESSDIWQTTNKMLPRVGQEQVPVTEAPTSSVTARGDRDVGLAAAPAISRLVVHRSLPRIRRPTETTTGG